MAVVGTQPTRWFWYAVTAVNRVSGKMNTLKFCVRWPCAACAALKGCWTWPGTCLAPVSDTGTCSTWKRGWYRCIEFRMIWRKASESQPSARRESAH